MDFFKRLFKFGTSQGKKVSEEPTKLSIENINEKLDQILTSKKEEALDRSIPNVKEILRQKEIATETVEDLRDLEFEEDVKDRTYKPILTSKPVYVRRMLESLKGIKKGEPQTFEQIQTFNADATKALKSIQSVQHKHGKYMKYAFEKEVLRLGSSLNKILDETNAMGEKVSEVQRVSDDVEEAMKNLDTLKEKNQLINNARKGKDKLIERIQNIDRDIDRLQREIKKIEGSEEYKSKLKNEDEIERIDKKKDEIKNSFINSISPLKRPIRKFERLIERGGSKKEKLLLADLRKYLASPTDAFESENPNDMAIERILNVLKEAMLKERINLDKRRREKALTKIEELSKGHLKDLLKEYLDLKDTLKAAEEKLSTSDLEKKRESLMNELESVRKKRKESESKSMAPLPKTDDLLKNKADAEKTISSIIGEPIELILPNFGK
jgi:hypothetical protein